jgi:hypothetical protein
MRTRSLCVVMVRLLGNPQASYARPSLRARSVGTRRVTLAQLQTYIARKGEGDGRDSHLQRARARAAPTIAGAVALEPAHETWVLADGHRDE